MKEHIVKELIELLNDFNSTNIIDIKQIQGKPYTGTPSILMEILPKETLDSKVEDFYPDAVLNRIELRPPHFVIFINDL